MTPFRHFLHISLPIVCVIGGLVAWHTAIVLLDVPTFLLPTPLSVWHELYTHSGDYLWHLGFTFRTAFTGYVIGIAIGITLAALFVMSRTIERGLYPYVLAIKIMPTVAFVPLLVLWLGLGIASKIIIVVLMCFFPVFVGTLKGLRATNGEQLDVFRSFGATRWQILRLLRLPSALPYLFPALKVSALTSLSGALIGEYIASSQGIGYLAFHAMHSFDSAGVFAAVTALTASGFVLFGFINALERHVVFWQHDEVL